jgi:secreted trypsin-like serine protease
MTMPIPRHLCRFALHCAIGAVALLLAVAMAAHAGTAPVVAYVVNGSTMSDAEFQSRWPFVVGIVNSRSRTQYEGQFCGGTLLDSQHVVTAAHCLTLRPGVVAAPSAIRIVSGTRTLDRTSLGQGDRAARRVKEIFVHPDFAVNAGDGFRYDVAVIRLLEPIPDARPIAMVQAEEDALWGNGAGGREAQVAGWGDTDPEGRGSGEARFPADLRAATVPLHADARCSSSIGGGYGTSFERATNLCGGSLQSGSQLGVDACQGDSGGPLVVDAVDGTRRLVGITSWGEGCAQRTFGAYARIAALRGWIGSIPGVTDGGMAIGGPGGTLSITNQRRSASDFRSVTFAWDAPALGAPAERYAIWRRTLVSGDAVDQLVGITTRMNFRAFVAPTRVDDAYTFVVRPLDAGGSNGPVATIRTGPRADRIRPTQPGAIALVRRDRGAVLVRWTSAIDRQSGVARYQVQRRIVGRTGFANVTVSSTPGRVRIGGLRRGEQVQVRARAFDRAGNAGAWRLAGPFTPRD